MSPKIVVLDDDPTGSQTVHSCLLLTRWDVATLKMALADAAPLFFVLTNTRGMDAENAAAVTREVCRNLRQRSNVPIIMVTAKDSEVDKVVGLELGADDYVTKPFSSRELVARIRAVLRRTGEPEELLPAVLEAGPVRMDVERHVVSVSGTPISLPLKEFELLELLLRNSGRVLTRGMLIDRVWGSDYVGDGKTLDVHVKRLRAKIEADPAAPMHLVTVRGLGYKFEN